MKKILVIVMLCMAAGAAGATPVDSATAQRVAVRFWQDVLHGRGTVEPVAWHYEGLRLFMGAQGGYVLVAGDDCARPVLAYSLHGVLDTASLPCQLTAILESWNEQFLWAAAHGEQPTAAVAAGWWRLLDDTPLKEGSDDGVPPLLTTLWNQEPYYNALCPGDTPTGCGITAQAQVMRFWSYPAFGRGSHSYIHNTYGTLSADFGHTRYDWQHMPSQLTAASSEAEVNAVATLMYHIGVSVEADYHHMGTGSGFITDNIYRDQPTHNNSVRNYFFYRDDCRPLWKDDGYSDLAWTDSLATELRLGHPVLYAGLSSYGGHGWVCDGYEWQNEERYFHFNFGWSGVGDGYYTVDSIAPGIGPNGQAIEGLEFNMYQQMLLNVMPDWRMHTGVDYVRFDRTGGTDSLLFCVSDTSQAPWSATSDQPWLTVDTAGTGRAGWVRVTAGESDGTARVATLIFRQGDDSVSVRIDQMECLFEEMCPLRVAMRSSNGYGWKGGAYLTLESAGGFVYGAATLPYGREDTATILVGPHDIQAVWHSGGATDVNISYAILNPYGEEAVAVANARTDGGTHPITWPCAHVGLDEVEDQTSEVSVWPNPASDVIHIEAKGLQRVELYSLEGKLVGSGQRVVGSGRINLSTEGLASGIYLLRAVTESGVYTGKIVKR